VPRTPRQMHGRRVFAAAAAAGLLVSLFAPWYRETVVARGVTGLRTLTLTRSGWQAFSATELLILVVAVLSLLIVIGMGRDDPDNRDDRAPDRLRLSGVVVAALGTIAFVVVLVRLTTAPGTTQHALDETMVAIRWGIFLGLVCSAALTAAGLRLIRARQPTAGRAPAERSPQAERPPRAERLARAERRARTKRPPRADDGGPAAAPPSRRPDGVRPTRRSDRPRWDEQASGWLDFPD
jgi:MFS family permease